MDERALGASIAEAGPLYANYSKMHVATPCTWYVTHQVSRCSGTVGAGSTMQSESPEAQPAQREQWEQGSGYEAFMGRWSRLLARAALPRLGVPPGRRWLGSRRFLTARLWPRS